MKNNYLQLQIRLGASCLAGVLLILSMALPSAANAKTSVVTTAWQQVANRTACEAMNPLYCAGIHGFVVNDHGHFIVGPNPSGKTLEGELTAGEFAQLKAHADAIATDIAADPVGKCESGPHMMGTADVITLTVGAKVYSVTDGLNTECSYNGDSESTKQLKADVRQLRQKYYVTPF